MTKFNISEALVTNEHGLQEIKLNMSDMIVSGSASYTEKTTEIFTQYSLEINKNKFIDEAFTSCKSDNLCNINVPNETIMFNSLIKGI